MNPVLVEGGVTTDIPLPMIEATWPRDEGGSLHCLTIGHSFWISPHEDGTPRIEPTGYRCGVSAEWVSEYILKGPLFGRIT